MQRKPTYEELEKRVQQLEKAESDRKQTLEAINKSNEKFSTMFANHHAIMLLIEPESGQILDANRSAENFYGYSIDKLRTMAIQEINVLPPEEVAAERRLAVTEKRNYFIFPHRISTGEILTVEVHSTPLIIQDQKLLFSIVHDISDKKQAEEALWKSEKKYRKLIESTHAVAWEFDLEQDRWTYVAPQAEAVFGFLPHEWTNLDFWKNRLHPEDREKTAGLCMTLTTRGEDHILEYRFLKKNGETIWVRDIVEVESKDGRPIRLRGFMFDISDRKRVEESLRKTTERLGLAQNAAKAGTWDWDIINGHIDWSSHLFEIFGLDPAKTSASFETWLRVVHPHDLEVAEERIYRALKERTTLNSDYRIVLPNGQTRWIYAVGRGEYNALYQPTHMLGICIDITERKQAERDLYEMAERLRFANMATSDVIWDWDVIHDTQQWNEAGIAVFGWSEIVHRPVNANWWVERVHPDERERVQDSFFAVVNNPALNVWHDEYRFQKADGTYADVMDRGFVLRDEKGKAIRMIGAMQNITERKKAEQELLESRQKYQSMVESVGIGVSLINEHMEIIELNRQMREWFPEIDPVTKPICYKAFNDPPRDTICDWCPTYKTLRDGKMHESITKTPGSGGVRNYRIVSSPIVDSEGKIKAAIEVVDGVTEKQKFEEQLRKTQRIESIGTLAGGIAHDFNNILSPIIGLSEMLMEDLPADSLHHENAAEINKAGIRARNLVKQILSFSRQAKLEKIPIQVQHILKEVIKLTRATIPSNIEITQYLQSECGLIMADPTQLHQVAMNLITNAYHALEETGGNISVRLKEVQVSDRELTGLSLKAGKYAVFSVSDNGCGINPAIMGRIFEPYFTTKEQGKGTGLGLAVVFGIVKDHHGDIKVCSELGRGTTFDVYLPIMAQAENSSSVEVEEDHPKGHEHILLVDDEEAIAKLEKQMLERLGYKVTMCVNSLDALEAFTSKPNSFDLVISDMNMPNITGDRLASELIAIRPNVPIIICTGFSDRIDQERAASIGVKGFLMKPIVKSEMARTVRKMLDEAKG